MYKCSHCLLSLGHTSSRKSIAPFSPEERSDEYLVERAHPLLVSLLGYSIFLKLPHRHFTKLVYIKTLRELTLLNCYTNCKQMFKL